jgi:hypothetical protein
MESALEAWPIGADRWTFFKVFRARRNENNGRRLIDEVFFNERRKVEPLIGNRLPFDVNIGMERRAVVKGGFTEQRERVT